ncbi:TRAP transporter substrate-binding protein [Abyssalbus ytuae]|uniref:TRAP transporter substrate-binding protein n=1 Tax=Abyssalbus ytuae TaxID=2926907 RepID=A0A9E6ZWK7_9FLAO|nr:TRAP transporter substrate-binding protein [Abyssalbus ytuae]UOB19093.1 TRAP transporter substrate-binding protein [Abyssalbus ytuae]
MFFFCVLLFFSSCKSDNHIKYIKLAHSLGVTHPVHKAMVYLAERVDENSQGKLQIQIYPSSQLGSERQCLELLQIGSLGMTKVSAAVMENFSPQLEVFGYPYIFENAEARYKVYDGDIGKKLLLDGEKYWLRGLTYFDAGSRSFYTKNKPVEKPEDLKGMKIRVMQSPTAIELVKSFDAAPTPISWGELYTALQQGVVEGAENNLPSFYTSRHYEVCKYFSVDEHSAIPDILVISTIVWNDLSGQEKEWLMKAVKDATLYQRKLWKEAEEKSLKAIKEANVKVNYPDKTLFKLNAAGMIEDLKTGNPELYDLISEIKKIK